MVEEGKHAGVGYHFSGEGGKSLRKSALELTDKGRTDISQFIDRQEKNCPRIFNVLFFVLIPILLLLCWCIFCGSLLARLEQEAEMVSNDTIIAKHFHEWQSMNEHLSMLFNAVDDCVDQYIQKSSNPPNLIDLKTFMIKCRSDSVGEITGKIYDEKYSLLLKDEELSFNWNTCSMDKTNTTSLSPREQGKHVLSRWNATANDLFESYNSTESNRTEIESVSLASIIDNAGVPRESCSTNYSGGSIFWFTVMTTIGYGNTVPVTDGGKVLVSLLGFLSILAFTALSGSAGYIMLSIVDDMFIRHNMKRLTKGWVSVLFWLFCLFLSMILLAELKDLTEVLNNVDRGSFSMHLWFSLISITTVGLGDAYIPHETFHQQDMFFFPLLMLVGFVCLANFLIKLSETISELSKRTGLTDDESLGLLLQQSRYNDNTAPNEVVLHNSDEEETNNAHVAFEDTHFTFEDTNASFDEKDYYIPKEFAIEFLDEDSKPAPKVWIQ